MRRPNLDDPDLPLADLMTHWPETLPVFMRHKMLCVGCMVSPFHTLAEACRAYDLDQSNLLAELKEVAGV